MTLKIGMILLSVAVVTSCGDNSRWRPQPTDREMQEHFTNQREAFDNLLRLASTDAGVARVSQKHFTSSADLLYTAPDPAVLSRSRWDEYRRLLDALELEDGIENRLTSSGCLWLWASYQGGAVGGRAKGYAYCRRSPSVVVDSLDSPPEQLKGEAGFAYKALSDGWYLYYES